jgi:hypothetical protein
MALSTHRFHSFETLTLARDWLGKMGIPSDHIHVSAVGLPSLMVETEVTRLPEVEMIINAAETSDPEGWPSWDTIVQWTPVHMDSGHDAASAIHTHSTPIGWHPIE